MNCKITNLSICLLYFLLIIASFVLFDIKNILISTNAFLVIIIGFVISLFFNYIYIKLESKNILSMKMINKNKFTRAILLISLLSIFSYAINLTSNFISYNLLENVPLFIISLTLIFLVIFLKDYKLNSIFNIANILFYFFIIIMAFIIISLIPQIDLKNISINLKNINVFKEAIYYGIITSYPMFLLNIIKNEAILEKGKIMKQLIITNLIANGLILLIIFIIINVIGKNVINLYPYPNIIVLRYINYFDVFERMENILSLVWLFSLTIFIIINVYVIRKILKLKKLNFLFYVILYFITFIKVNYKIFIICNIIIFIISFLIYLFSKKRRIIN